MKTEKCTDSKSTLVAGMFYTFVILTVVAFLLHLFGLDWFAANVEIPEPNSVVNKLVKASLKAFELVFIYKMLTKKDFVLCTLIAVLQTAAIGVLPTGAPQSISDCVLMFAFPLLFRKDRWWAVVDTIFIYIVMCLYGSLFMIAKFGGFSTDYGYSFYANIVGVIDYKLFVVTMYLYTKYRGGIRLWMKRKLLS